jgi:hypothetical protein
MDLGVLARLIIPSEYLGDLHFVIMEELGVNRWADSGRLSSDFYA